MSFEHQECQFLHNVFVLLANVLIKFKFVNINDEQKNRYLLHKSNEFRTFRIANIKKNHFKIQFLFSNVSIKKKKKKKKIKFYDYFC